MNIRDEEKTRAHRNLCACGSGSPPCVGAAAPSAGGGGGGLSGGTVAEDVGACSISCGCLMRSTSAPSFSLLGRFHILSFVTRTGVT
jgi:hypothetical protein